MNEVLVGLIVAASTIGGVWLTQRSEHKRAVEALAAQVAEARRQEERQLRDGKRERVRAAYTDVLVTARSLPQRAKAMGWLHEVAGVNERADEEVQQAFADLERSLAALLLESDAQDAVSIFEEVRKAFVEFRTVMRRGVTAMREAGEKPGTQLLVRLNQCCKAACPNSRPLLVTTCPRSSSLYRTDRSQPSVRPEVS
jgi:hypothetical protein